METKYWIPTLEEAKTFKTFSYELHAMTDEIIRFYKMEFPDFCNISSEIPKIIEEQKEFYKISNNEDMYVLEQEKIAFDKYYSEQKAEILPYLI